jgi:hypothetical protein
MKIIGHPNFNMEQGLYEEEIVKKFKEMHSVWDLANLLQFVYSQKFELHFKKKNLIFKPNTLTYYAYILKKGEGYKDFEIMKKNGGKRIISSPKFNLKLIQRCLLEVISVIYHPHKAAHGFILGKNVASNASIHIGKKYIFNIDLKDFFPSTSFHKINFLLKIKPFYLNKEREQIAQLIANLCCKEGVLPQGAPTSPIFTNIVCRRIDSKLSELAFENKAKYSRYADDITFSCQEFIFNDSFFEKIKTILIADKYEINHKKTRISNWNQRQEVTGVLVNKFLNLPREYIKDIRYWLFSWQKFGELNTQSDFEKRFPQKNGFKRYNGITIKFNNYLYGKIQYLKMIRGNNDLIVLKFLESFHKLNNKKVLKNADSQLFKSEGEIGSLHKQIIKIRAALELRGDMSIDYSFVAEDYWAKQLMADNLKMENCGVRILGDDGRLSDPNDGLSDFCRYACFQIELLLNIYFKKKYPNWIDLVTEISELKRYNKISQDFKLYSYNRTTNNLSLKTKWDIYSRVHLILHESDLYKGVNSIREIRNIKTAHRPAQINEVNFGAEPNQSILQYTEIILKGAQTEPIRNFLMMFVEHIKSKMPT